MVLRSGGLVSGLDSNTLIQQLISIERQPIMKLQGRKAGFETQISKLGKLKSSLSTLKTTLKGLDSLKELQSMTATSSDDTLFTTTAKSTATPGSYAVEVSSLAAPEKNRSNPVAADATMKAGTISFAVAGGDTQSITIEDGDSLATVSAKINESIDGVYASVVNDGTNSYLSISSKDTGFPVGENPSDMIVITESYSGGGGAELGLTETQQAKNAELTIDGLAVTSMSNSVEDAISGVTIDLKKVTTGPETITVAADTEAIKEKLQKFVDTYNEVIDLVKKETTVTASTSRNSSLAGDPTIRSLRSVLSRGLTEIVPSLEDATYNSLASIGIKTDSAGKLTIDDTTMNKALAEDLSGALEVFAADDGIAGGMIGLLDPFVDLDGVLDARKDGLNQSIKGIDKRISNMELRIETMESALVKQFTALESSMSQIQSQGSYLMSALAG